MLVYDKWKKVTVVEQLCEVLLLPTEVELYICT